METKNKPSGDNLKWWVLATVIIGTFLGRLDQSIVNLALPTIINDFGITVSAASWIATAYIIANAVFVPIWGKLGDTIGRKKVYMMGFSIFIFGSVLAGFAWNLNSMLVFRVIQAIASSADYPTAMAIIAVTFKQGRDRAQALGIWSASFAAASVFGPLLGGPLIDTFGWRSVFLINLPIGILGIYMASRYIHESVSTKKDTSFDIFGALTLGVFLSSLVLVLDKGAEWGWLSLNSMIAYAVALSFILIFIIVEKNHKEPLVDFRFFSNKLFMGAIVNNFLIFFAMMGAIFLIPLFAQTFLGYNATETGLLFIPMAFFMVMSAQIGGRTVGKIKANYVVALSTLIAAIGLFLFAIMLDARSTAIDIIIPLSIFAFGMGLGMSQRTNAIASAVPQNEIGVASGILALVRNISGAFGIAIFTTLLTNSINSNVINLSKHTIINSLDPVVFKEVMALIILKAEIMAYSTNFLVAAILVLIGAVLAFFVKMSKDDEALKTTVHVEG